MITFENLNSILMAMNNKGINGFIEFYVYMFIVENPRLTNKEIAEKTKINFSQLKALLVTLKNKGLINSVDNDNDKTKRQLKQQLYFACDEITKEANTKD